MTTVQTLDFHFPIQDQRRTCVARWKSAGLRP